jgi:hypothetical protein
VKWKLENVEVLNVKHEDGDVMPWSWTNRMNFEMKFWCLVLSEELFIFGNSSEAFLL